MFPNQRLAKQVLYVTSLVLLTACSKNDTIAPPVKHISRQYNFNIFPGGDIPYEQLQHTRIKLRLSLSGINVVNHERTIIWDTLIARTSLQELCTKEQHCRLNVSLTAPEASMRHVVASYNIILEYKGVITNRSGVASQQGSEKDIPVEV
ncbi:MAG: hypothetical protein EOO04_01430 [Chitinophagaceae bacterium]|nr:MAG: hypothetical protein EOO04_01430 [Chitinophagaceae bacterium]